MADVFVLDTLKSYVDLKAPVVTVVSNEVAPEAEREIQQESKLTSQPKRGTISVPNAQHIFRNGHVFGDCKHPSEYQTNFSRGVEQIVREFLSIMSDLGTVRAILQECEHERDEVRRANKQLTKDLKKADEDLRDSQVQNVTLKESLQVAHDQIEDLKRQATQALAERDKAVKERDVAQSERDAANARSHEAERARNEALHRTHDVEGKLADANTKIVGLKTQLDVARTQVRDAQAQRDSADARAHKLETELTTVKSKIHGLEEKLHVTRTHLHEAHAQRDSANARAHKLEAELATAKERLRVAEAAAISFEKEAAGLRHQVTHLTDELRKMTVNRDLVQANYEALHERDEQLKKDHKSLETKYEKLETALRRANEDIARLESEKDILDKEVKIACGAKEAAEKAQHAAEHARDIAEKKACELQTTVKALTKEKSNLELQLDYHKQKEADEAVKLEMTARLFAEEVKEKQKIEKVKDGLARRVFDLEAEVARLNKGQKVCKC